MAQISPLLLSRWRFSGARDLSPNTFTINVTPVNDAPVYHNFNSGSAGTFNEGQTTPIFLDFMHNGEVEDIDSADFAGGSLRVSITQGGTPVQDKLGIDNSGTVMVSGTAAGSTVSVGGVVIGTIASGGTGVSEDLVVNLNASANADRVELLVRALTYFNLATDNPTQTTRIATISLNDGDGPQISPVSININIQGFNDAPALSDPSQSQVVYVAGQPLVALWQGVIMSDPDDQANFIGGNIQMSAGSGGAVLELVGTRFTTQNAGPMMVIVDTTTNQQVGQLSGFGGSLQVFNLTSAATGEVVNALIHSFGFRTEGVDPALGNFQASLTFFDGFSMFGGGLTSNIVHQTVTVGSVTSLPIVDLNGNGPGIDGMSFYTEGGVPVGISGPSSPFVFGPNGGQLDKMTIVFSSPDPGDILTWGTLPTGISVSVSDLQFERVITFTGVAAPSAYQSLLGSLRYSSSSDAPPSQRDFRVSVHSGGFESANAFSQIVVGQTDDPGTARDDQFFTGGADIFFAHLALDNGFGPDVDPDGLSEVVAVAVNGSQIILNTWVTLPSGARLNIGSFGGVSFDPDHVIRAGCGGIHLYAPWWK